jgi:predicted Zn-ribbon and HTH transcriptional regulator
VERELLSRYLEQGLSLDAIGVLTARDPSTVGYWVQKHGFEANGRYKHRARGGLTREQLAPLVDRGATVREIAAAVDRSPSTVRYWLRRLGMKTNSYRENRRMALEARRAGNRRFAGVCKRHGATDFFAFPNGRSRCGKCSSEAVSRRRRKLKRILVAEAGGRCELCGYDRCIRALEFHHRNPEEKVFGVAERGFTRSIAELRTEASKCALLCANCHAEVEEGVAELPVK